MTDHESKPTEMFHFCLKYSPKYEEFGTLNKSMNNFQENPNVFKHFALNYAMFSSFRMGWFYLVTLVMS